MVEPPARQRGRLQSMLPAGLFLLGLAVAAFVGLQVQRSVDKAEAEEFVRSTDRVAQEVVRRFEQPVYGLNGARGVYAAHPHTNRSAFRAYVESRDLAGEFPGVRGLGFIQRVPIAGVEPFLAAERADGAPQFAIRRLSQQSQGDLYVIKLIEPARSNAGAAGLDVGSEANRRAAIERAIASGLPTMTAPISLVQAARRTPGLLLFVPAFHPDQPQSTPDERRQALRGVLYAPIVYAELLAGLVDVVGGRIGIRVLDDGAATAAEVEVFSAAPAPAGAAPAVTRTGDWITWWTGSAVMVFDKKLGYRYTIEGTGPLRALGPAAVMAGRLLIPVEGGLAVYDPANGAQERLIAIEHPPGMGAIIPAVVGSTVIEQRGQALRAFGP